MHTLESLAASPNSLAVHYSQFRVGERLLLTGHSHQAWPDCTREALLACHGDAAELVDDKWGRAFAKAERVRQGLRSWLAGSDGELTLGQNTHELLVRLLSALPLRERPRLVTTDGEFHSARRQLGRLAEEGIEVVRVAARPVSTLSERLAAALDSAPTAAVLVSSVLFGTAEIVPGLADLADCCERASTVLLIDAYHQLGVVPWQPGLERAYVVGGGYKYLQLGEGNCFLRTPADCALRPVITGWFAEFAELERAPGSGVTGYPRGPLRLAGATYDPVSHYRAASVCDFFAAQGLDALFLRANAQRQLSRLITRFEALDLDSALVRRATDTPVAGLGGFVALDSPRAAELHAALLKRGVHTDVRGTVLRLGPAPYLADAQLEAAVDALGDSARSLAG